MKIISPESLSFLEFRTENGIIIAKYGRQIISDMQENIPMKNLFSTLSGILKKVGNSECSYNDGAFIYQSDGCILKVDSVSGLPKEFSGNGYTVEFL